MENDLFRLSRYLARHTLEIIVESKSHILRKYFLAFSYELIYMRFQNFSRELFLNL